MKKTLAFIASLALALSFSSCNKDHVTPAPGDWEDNIILSTKSVELNDTYQTAKVQTKGTSWWIQEVDINGKHFHPMYESSMSSQEKNTVEADWLTVERVDSKTLRITGDKNRNNKTRTARIVLQSGKYFDYIAVSQPASRVSISSAKLVPSAIYSNSGAIMSYYKKEVHRFTYDDQNRIKTIVWQNRANGIDVNRPILTSTFEYGVNKITVTKVTYLEFDPNYVPTTKVTRYEINGRKVYINGANPIDIDDKGRALVNNYKYDANGNITSYDYFGQSNRTVDYEKANGVFRYVNMPSWYLTTQFNVMNGELNLHNNALVSWYTDEVGKVGFGYDMTYNTDDYPTKVTTHPIEMIGNGYSDWSIEYIKAK